MTPFPKLALLLLMGLTSCYSYVDLSSTPDYRNYEAKHKVYVLHLETLGADTILFSDIRPGILGNDSVKGYRHILMADLRPDSTFYFGRRNKTNYAVKDSVRYWINKPDQENKVYCMTQKTTAIPYSSVKNMYVKRFEAGKSALVSLAISAAGTLVTFSVGLFIMWMAYR